jgi:DNA-binding CsgD family transcriptional regulator
VPAAADAGLRDDGIPHSVVSLIARARAVFEGHEPGPARLRLRARSGRWMVLHASCMGDRSDGPVTVVIEPAKSSDVAPIIVEAYALSPRERDVVRAIARGMSSAEIAAELYLSPHTVRDYVKSVFEKVGVSSRGELVARLFADHYSEPLHVGAVHVN